MITKLACKNRQIFYFCLLRKKSWCKGQNCQDSIAVIWSSQRGVAFLRREVKACQTEDSSLEVISSSVMLTFKMLLCFLGAIPGEKQQQKKHHQQNKTKSTNTNETESWLLCMLIKQSYFGCHLHSWLVVLVVLIHILKSLFLLPISTLFHVINTRFFTNVRRITEFSSEIMLCKSICV